MNMTISGHPLASLPALLDAWNRHQDLRSEGANVRDLAESRHGLDQIRSSIR